jgi:hypothetical protein
MTIRKRSHLIIECVIAVLFVATTGTMIGTRDAEATASASTVAINNASAGNRLVVHEWGTFTSIAGKAGAAVKWRPLDGTNDLPGFVYNSNGLTTHAGLRHGQRCFKCEMEALVRMETPVLYFYADHETTVSVKVNFPKGKFTEWYPQARLVYHPDKYNIQNPAIIDWGRVNILPGANVNYPVEKSESHYYPARETDSAAVRVCGAKEQQYEKFLFYRGVGTFSVPLLVTLKDGKIVVDNLASQSVTPVILFENRGGKIGYQILKWPKRTIEFKRAALDQSIESLHRDLESILVAQGLYEKEAKAMIKTWRDSWFEEGVRVFYIMPRAITDTILPVEINPAPSELARVLVGRIEVITPEMELALRQQIAKLEDPSSNVRSEAINMLRKHGRFSEPILKNILQATNDPKLKARINQIINSARAATE